VEIVIDRRGSRPVRYGLIAALIGLAGLAATHFYAPDRSTDAKVQKAEAQAPQQVTIPVLDEASKRRIAALQDEVQELRTKLDAVENDNRPIVFAHGPPALRPLSKTKLLRSLRSCARDAFARKGAAQSCARREGKRQSRHDARPDDRAGSESVSGGYGARRLSRRAALIESDRGMIGVEPGEFVPGVGRVMAIQERAGRWVVVTESGEILGNARGQSRASARVSANSREKLWL
jgi:hypothetical protein